MQHIITFAVGVLVMTACSGVKPVARTVNDAARLACEIAFGQDELPKGMSVEQLCEAQEDLQPFIRNILAAKRTVGASHGVHPPPPTE